MPSSNYEQFDVKVWDASGVHTPLANYTLKVYDATNLVDLADMDTDSNGVIAAGTLSGIDIGTRIRWRVENYLGMTAYYEQITT